MKLICKNCGQEFERPRKPKDINNVYCSINCSSKGKIKKIKCSCGQCGAEIEKIPSDLKNSKSGLVFCNKSCACAYNNTTLRSGENNPNWKDGSHKTSNYANKAFRYYKNICSICGFSEQSCLNVHHIDENRENDDIDNLIILCANHHSMIHYGNLIITQEIKNKRECLQK